MNLLTLIALALSPCGATASPDLPALSGSYYLGELHPKDLVLSPDGTKLFVAACLPGEGDSGQLLFLNAADGKETCGRLKVAGEPASIVLAADGKAGYVTNTGDGYQVTRFNPAKCALSGSVRSGGGPDGLAMSHDGSRVFVANNWESFVTVFDAKWREPVTRLDGFGAGAGRMATTADGRTVYVAGRSGKIWKLDTENLTVGRPLSYGAADLTLAPDGKTLYAAGLAADPVIRGLSVASDDVVVTLPLETPASGIVVLPGGRYLYAALAKANQVVVFDLDQAVEVARVRVGNGPRRLVATRDGKTVYVACAGDTKISVLATGGYGQGTASTEMMDSRMKVAAATPLGLARTTTGGILSIAVGDLEAQGVADSSAAVVSDWLRGALVQSGAFNVLERKNMRKIMEEQAIQQTGCTSEECAVKLGRLLNVQRMIVGSVGKFEASYVVNVRVVDIETGKAVASDTAKGASIDDVETAVKGMARRLVVMH